jgi:acyl carrier protein
MSATVNEQKFRAVVSAVLGIAPGDVSDALSSQTVDTWDSLTHINLFGALEQEFGVLLPTDSLAAAQSVSSLKALLAGHGVEL